MRIAGAAATLFVVACATTLGGCSRKPARFEQPPDILLIVVDTLRADHLPFHGYRRNTAPRIAELMAEGGVLFENAHAPASWTGPSVAAILTGKEPSRLVTGGDLRAFGIPDAEQTLAERLAEAGYETAAFVGNVLLHQGQGFGQGFGKYWMVPGGLASIPEPAETVLEPALDWLAGRASSERPYFAYVHFMDPHDPYTSPDLIDGRSEFFPDYSGPLAGRDIHFLNSGEKQLSSDPSADVEHLRALYDSEIRYVDRAVGLLIEAAEASSRRPTLVVFTSDHGEEIFDHGGWGHARTVYEETIHVPLLFRAAGLVRGGVRVRGNCQVLDIGRTLLAAAGLPADELDGENLLPVVLGEVKTLPRRPIFVRHWQRGPMRGALIVDQRRTLLYNRGQPFDPDSDLETHLWREDAKRLPRFASFDLARDPGQLRPLDPDPDEAQQALDALDASLDGLRVVLRGLGAGRIAAGTLRFSSTPIGTLPLFLADGDAVEIEGAEVRFRLAGERLPKGFVVLGDLGRLEEIDLAAGSDLALELGQGAPWTGSPIEVTSLRTPAAPAWSGRPGLRIWNRESRATASERTLDAETRASLRALGYL